MTVQTPLRICLVVDSVKSAAGTEKLVAEFASRLDPNIFEIHVCCFEQSERLAALPPHIRKVVLPVPSVFTPAGLWQVTRFRRYLRRNRIQLLQCFMNRSAIFSGLAAIGTDCGAVISSRLNTGYWYTPKHIRVFRTLNRITTHVVTNSALAKKVTMDVEKLPPDKITVLYPGVDLERFGPSAGDPSFAAALGIPPTAKVVGIVANFRHVKDLPLFLRSARLVADAIPESAFLLVGQGELKSELQNLARELGLADRVFFSDPETPVPNYLSRMSIACLSSESEGLPNAILEYMAAGLPVVATDVGGNSELVADGENGYLVRERTPEAFSAPLIRLLRDEPQRAKLGRQGLELARRNFDMKKAVRRLEEFYLHAAAGIYDLGIDTLPFSTAPTDRK